MFSLISFCFNSVKVEALENKVGEYPVVLPARNLTFYVGEEVDLYSIITATDKEDGEIVISEDNTNIIGEIDFYTPGVYNLTFEVKDSDGNVSICALVIIVEERKDTKVEDNLDNNPPTLNNDERNDNQTYKKTEDENLIVEVPDTGLSYSDNKRVGILIIIVSGIIITIVSRKIIKE